MPSVQEAKQEVYAQKLANGNSKLEKPLSRKELTFQRYAKLSKAIAVCRGDSEPPGTYTQPVVTRERGQIMHAYAIHTFSRR